MQLIIGIILGIFIATVGLGGLVNAGDKVVQKVQAVSKEVAK